MTFEPLLTQKHLKIFFITLAIGMYLAVQSYPVKAETVTAAVAANFSGVIKQLKPIFEHETDHTLNTSFASTGTLFAQIRNGAPFDIFLSADDKRPQQLINDGLAVSNSQFVYATGLLTLWSSQPDLIDDQGKILSTSLWSEKGIRHIALANPKIAPYGAAAVQTLSALKLLDETTVYRVTGQSITQTFQFVISGNAQLGFIAQSQILTLPPAERGSYWQVPKNLYTPLKQSAVLLTRGQKNLAAQSFLNFLQTPQALSIINSQGYLTSSKTQREQQSH